MREIYILSNHTFKEDFDENYFLDFLTHRRNFLENIYSWVLTPIETVDSIFSEEFLLLLLDNSCLFSV
jgi:hypothetical protein